LIIYYLKNLFSHFIVCFHSIYDLIRAKPSHKQLVSYKIILKFKKICSITWLEHFSKELEHSAKEFKRITKELE